MSQAIVGGIIGALASTVVIKRVVNIDGIYVSSGATIENVIFGVCVDNSGCEISYVDYDGNNYTSTLANGDIVIAKKVDVRSGRMFALTFKTTGLA